MRTPTRLALVAFVAFALAPFASANLVTNGGFETGDFTGWTHVGNTLLETAIPHSGSFHVGFGPGGTLSQSFATTAGTTYTFSFWLIEFSTDDLNYFMATFGGTTVLNLTSSDIFGPYTLYSFNVVATSALTAVQFSSVVDAGVWRLDDISVEQFNGASVPETGSTLAFLGLALVAVEGRRRRLATPNDRFATALEWCASSYRFGPKVYRLNPNAFFVVPRRYYRLDRTYLF